MGARPKKPSSNPVEARNGEARSNRSTRSAVAGSAAPRLDVLIEQIDVGMIFTDEIGRIVISNSAFRRLFDAGSTRAAFGHSLSDLVAGGRGLLARPSVLAAQIADVQSARQPIDTLEFALSDGRLVRAQYQPVTSDQVTLGALWLFQEADDRPDQTPLRSMASISATLGHAPIIVFALDALPGDDEPNDGSAQPIVDMLREAPSTRVGELILGAFAGSETSMIVEFDRRAYDVRVSPFRDDSGAVARLLGVAHDITEHKLMEESLRRQNSYLAMLHETTLTLANRLDLRDLLEGIVLRAAAMVGSDHGYIYVVDPGGKTITSQYGSGLFQNFIGFQMQMGEGIGGKVCATGQPLVVPDYETWEGRSPKWPPGLLHTVAAVPLKSGDEVTGAIGVAHTKSGKALDENDLKALAQFAELASIAIDNARLYASAQGEIAERRRTEEALRSSEARYRSMITAMAEGVLLYDSRGQITASNETARRLLGLNDQQLLGQTPDDMAPRYIREDGSMLPGAEHPASVTLRTGRPQSNVVMGVRAADGSASWISVNSQPFSDDGDPNTRSVVTSFSDITESKQAGEALQRSERRNKALLEAIPDMILVLTRTGVCVECKPDDAGSMLAPPDQLIGHNLRDFPLGEGVNRLLQNHLERTLVSGNMETFIYELPSTNGHYEARMAALNDEEVLCIIRDITDRRSAEIELNKRLEVLAALQQVDAEVTQTLNIDYVLAVALDATLRLSNANAGFIALVEGDQIQVAQAIGRYPLESTQADPMRLREGIVGRVVRMHRAALVADVFEDNDYIPVLPTTRAQIVIPLVSHDMLVGVLNLETNQMGRFNDELFNFLELLTARIAVAIDNARLYQVSQTQLAQLKDLYGQVSELEQLKTQMIRIAAHDLRSPLGVVSGYISLLEEELGSDVLEQHRSYFGPIHRAINRMQRMTTDVLSLERIHAAQARDWQDMSLRDLVERAVLDQRDQSTSAGLEMRVEMPTDDIVMRADPVQLYEAVTNLINNAIKYTPQGGTVTVRLYEDNKNAIFDVQDTGMGVPEEYRAGLFRPFYRVKTQETKDIDGTGLGLYLVKGIVDRHNGTMRFQTEHGKGSLFGFELPLTGPQTTEIIEEKPA